MPNCNSFVSMISHEEQLCCGITRIQVWARLTSCRHSKFRSWSIFVFCSEGRSFEGKKPKLWKLINHGMGKERLQNLPFWIRISITLMYVLLHIQAVSCWDKPGVWDKITHWCILIQRDIRVCDHAILKWLCAIFSLASFQSEKSDTHFQC